MSDTPRHADLLRVVRAVRNRWRARVILQNLALVVGIGVVVLLVSAFAVDKLRFAPAAVTIARSVAYLAVGAAAVRLLVLPLLRRVTDQQVALYLEEHEPGLDGQLLSAVQFGSADGAGSSRALVERLVASAVDRCAGMEGGLTIEREALRRSSGLLAGATATAAAVLFFSPGFLQHGARTLLFPWDREAASSPYAILVEPGDTVVARGADLKLGARLQNFESDQADLAVRSQGASQWERWPMTFDETAGGFALLLFDLTEGAEYFVEAGGVRSATHRIEVADLPYVRRIDLEYRFPAYTGLSPRVEEDGGDVAALRGTRVRVSVTPTIAVPEGVLVVESDTIPLEPAVDGALAGTFTVEANGFYRVLFRTALGQLVVGSPDYLIDVFEDQPPSIRFTEPGRDMQVTAVEEVFAEVVAEDDYGIRALDLVFSVNGGDERVVSLYGGATARSQLTAGHTFFLEDLDLEPGDLVSYFARTTDAGRSGDGAGATTDIYFLEVRPFDRIYRQAEQQPGGMGGEGMNGALSERQRQIVAGTFKVVRDRRDLSAREFGEHLATLTLSQGRLREEVETLVGRIENRQIVSIDSTFATIAEALRAAMTAMEGAEEALGRREPEPALPPEQQALRHLQRAEAVFREVQVARGSGGGQGGGGEASAEELADLFDLEMDRLRNQYEQVQRGRRQEVDAAVDETLEKLRELARRQQQQNERLRAQGAQGGGGGGGDARQRDLAEEAQELARRLERLSREESSAEMAETAREVREAADAMRRAAAGEGERGLSQGRSALDRLREARRLLEEGRTTRLEREVQDALRRAERLSQEQGDVADAVEELTPGERGERMERLIERKERMAQDVEGLETDLDRLARDARRTAPDVARELQEAATAMRDEKLRDKILYSRGVVQGRSPEYARNFEEQIQSDLEALVERLGEAVDAAGEGGEEQGLARALDRTRDLANALESLDARIRQRGERGQQQGDRGGQGEAEDGGAAAGGGDGARPGQAEANPQSGDAGGPPRGLGPGDRRQFQRELGERREELGELRRELREQDIDVAELDRILSRLEALRDRPASGDVRALETLREEIVQGLREFEYGLRRSLLEGDAERLLLTGSDDVPPGYRELVEEYYRRLAEGR
jgi:hypothetical protein